MDWVRLARHCSKLEGETLSSSLTGSHNLSTFLPKSWENERLISKKAGIETQVTSRYFPEISPKTDYREDGWSFCQRQRGERGKGKLVNTLQNQGWVHDGISIDGLLYKIIPFLGLVRDKYTQLLCKFVPKDNHSTHLETYCATSQ